MLLGCGNDALRMRYQQRVNEGIGSLGTYPIVRQHGSREILEIALSTTIRKSHRTR